MSGGAGQQRGPLPCMKTVADAVARCEQEKDPFYLTVFMIEAWLGQMALGPRPNTRKRSKRVTGRCKPVRHGGRFEVLRVFVQDWAMVRQGDHPPERLQMERERDKSEEEVVKQHERWAKNPQVREWIC